MTYFKTIALTVFGLACAAGLPAQTQANSPAAKKTIDEIRADGRLYSNRGFTFNDTFYVGTSIHDTTSVSFGISEVWDPLIKKDEVRLTELTLNGVALDPKTFGDIDTFVRQNIKQLRHPERDVISCSKESPGHSQQVLKPCEEIRIKFPASYHHDIYFKEPETGEDHSAGTCSIWITVRTRDASIWCYGDKGAVFVKVDG